MMKQHVITQEASGEFVVWQPCSDESCAIYHRAVCRTRDQSDAKHVAQALDARLPEPSCPEETPTEGVPSSPPGTTIFSWQIDTPVPQALAEAIGAASVCWEHPDRGGVFDSERAGAIVNELEDLLRRKLWTESG